MPYAGVTGWHLRTALLSTGPVIVVAFDDGGDDDGEMSDLERLIGHQAGVVTRAQLGELDVAPATIRRMVRRRDLVRVYPGVYVDHTGELTWLQRAWSGVLALEPAALCHRSALRAADGPGRRDDDAVIHVAVDRSRSPAAPPDVRLHHLADLDAKVRWTASPPRVRVEEAVIAVAAEEHDEVSAIAVLADAVQARRTTAARLLETLGRRPRIARRDLLDGALRDIAQGTCSALEHGYLTRVERPHGLPTATRQAPGVGIYRDVEYAAQGLVVELDGRLFHDDAASRDGDLERDLDAALTARVTVRLGWGQVFGRSCETATKVAALLQARGWTGAAIPCPACTLASVPYEGVIG